MVTNYDFPIKIEADDRRYIVCRCKAVHRDDVEYFTLLSNEILKVGTKESFHSLMRKRYYQGITFIIRRCNPIKLLSVQGRFRQEDQDVKEDANDSINH
ncbi:MAG: hypothetical protein EZS28_033300 [Streblomastix strix]|uniref:Uncharacterized protein n=1 Tax=Streblomastix strix TaxID=222440 RepID=A0A5J4ULM4_9EUKA|nr:MAG: hypothetical protein EZS28_033300 [Streblomastix strix]